MLTIIDFVLSYYGYMLEDLNIQTSLKQQGFYQLSSLSTSVNNLIYR